MDLIERQAALYALCEDCKSKYDGLCPHEASKCIEYRAINRLPAIEAEPVRHGRWIRNATSDGYHCSNCGHHVDSPIGEMIDPRDYECYLDKYCGGCGVKMYNDGGTISKERFAEIVGADNDD